MKLTQRRIQWFGELYDQVSERIDDYCHFRYKAGGMLTINSFYSNNITITYTWEEGCRGCYDTKSASYEVPHWVFNDDWKEKTLAIIEDEAYHKDMEITANRNKDRADTERKERAILELLKNKYE